MTVPRFWREQPQRYRLLGSECGVCGSIHFPPRAVCPKCRRESIGRMTQRELSGRGTILAHTIVHQPADGFELQVPYVMAIVELEEGCRLMTQVVDAAPGALKPGLAVEATFRRIREDGRGGVIYYGYKFRPVRSIAKTSASEEGAVEPVTARGKKPGRHRAAPKPARRAP